VSKKNPPLAAAPAVPNWSNEANRPPPPSLMSVPQEIDQEMRTPTPREVELAELAKANVGIKPVRYDITNKNARATRVVHDFSGIAVSIPSGETKQGVLLHPGMAQQLRGPKSDLELTAH
jgi:hypothetical protein